MARDRSEASEVIVQTGRLLLSTLGTWSLAVLSALALRIALLDAIFSAREAAVWLFLGCAPVGIVVLLARGQSTGSIAHVLHEAESTVKR
jgi:hypothetical protein